MSRRRTTLKKELPLLIWLVVVWGALWRDFSAGNLIFGALIALGVVNLFYLPPVELSGRFNIFHAVRFAGHFVFQLVQASIEVFWLAVRRGPEIRNAVVAVQLRTHSDLIVTAVGHTLSLIPGSLVVDVDRSTSTLYVHALNVASAQDAADIRAEIRASEARLIRVMGTREELELLNTEENLDRQLTPAGKPGTGKPGKRRHNA
jgi:multicomponent Na+:H+ antiporter subunit E